MALDGIEKILCDAIASRRDALLRDLTEQVAIPTGRNFAPGLKKYRELLISRLEGPGGLWARIEILQGDARPAWLDVSKRGEQNASATPPATADLRQAAGDDPGRVVIRATHDAKDNGSETRSHRVMIASHMDTVHDPDGSFRELTIEAGGKIARGPGVADMKGGIVIALHALEALAGAGIDINWTFLLNSDEERGSFHSARLLAETAKMCDVGIATEPALPKGELAIERMGSGQFHIEVFGKSAHVGRDFESGVSAVNKLAEIIIAVAKLADPAHGKIVNIGPITGGDITNAVPDHAACWGNVRYETPSAGDELAKAIDALATKDDAMPRVVTNRMWNRPAKPMTDGVKKLADSARSTAEDLGQSLPFAKTGGVCDGNIMQAAGLPVIDTLGVRGGNLHRTDEFIEIASLVERCQLLAVVLKRLSSGS